ncbi:hypothetical protein ZHAS_00003607 [Anopheles sinensis]|uniref:Uncharacterized protein n=1 Tax=Anopheles sinensis TaxID=74873 RepID=A0A084VEP3_ANOSI|nr:hypothetical protein ZHAS_00003607 [Anopheles sinensis]
MSWNIEKAPINTSSRTPGGSESDEKRHRSGKHLARRETASAPSVNRIMLSLASTVPPSTQRF